MREGSTVAAIAILLFTGCGAGSSAPDAGADAARRARDAGFDAGAPPADGGDASLPPVVGRECLPESVPASGFDAREVYIETTSARCAVGASPGTCMVYRLDGDPRRVDCAGCPTADEVREHVFCTCRCSTDTPGAAVCACPDGFRCVDDVITAGGPDLDGGYCVRDGL